MEQEQEQKPQVPEGEAMSGEQQDVATGGEQEHMSKNAIILIVLVVIVLVLVLMYVWGSRSGVEGPEATMVDEPTMTFDEFVTQNQPPLEEAANDVNAVLGTLQTQTFMQDIDALETDLDAALAQ